MNDSHHDPDKVRLKPDTTSIGRLKPDTTSIVRLKPDTTTVSYLATTLKLRRPTGSPSRVAVTVTFQVPAIANCPIPR